MKCAKCGEEISLSQVEVTEDKQFICRDCAIMYYTKCDRCNKYIPSSEGRLTCESCESYIYNLPLNAYNLKPTPIFKNKSNIKGDLNNRYYGLEIEYSLINANAIHAMMEDLYKERYIYNKSDSSLTNGVEIVTNPCDKSSIRNLIKRMKPTLDEIAKQRRYKTNAGIHIHVNKSSVSPIDIYKLSYLLNVDKNNNEEKNRLYFLCGRTRRYRDICDDHYFKIGSIDELGKLIKGQNRYKALNLCNPNTIEFRLFKTSAKADVILSYIEIVDKMIEFAHNFGFKDMTINNFLNYLYKNTKDKFILSKLKVIKNNHTLPEHKELSFVLDDDLLDGIEEEDYFDWLTVVTNSKYKYLKANLARYKVNKISDWSTIGKRNLNLRDVKKVERVLRKLYTEKIMEGIDLLCA